MTLLTNKVAWVACVLAMSIAVLMTPLLSAAAQASGPPPWCSEPRAQEFDHLERVQLDDPWFEVYHVSPGVYLLHEPQQWERVSSYLIVGASRALLFDSGLGVGNIHALVRRITALPVVVLNSHTHFDHVGGNADFERVWNLENTYSRTSARGLMEPVLGAYARETLEPARLCKPLPAGLSNGLVSKHEYRLRPWQVSHRVKDGEVIRLGGRELVVMETPGHSPDSLCLHDEKNGLLFTGDTFYRGDIYVWMPGANVQSYGRSIRKLTHLAPHLKLLLPGHGPATATPADLADVAHALEQIRAGAVNAVVSEGNREYRFNAFTLVLPQT